MAIDRIDSASSDETVEKPRASTANRYDFSILKFLRKQRGITLQELSKISGVSYAPLANLENNKIKPNLDTLDKICMALEIPTYNLLALAERKSVEQLGWTEYDHANVEMRFYDFGEYTIYVGSMKKGAVLKETKGHRMYFETVFVHKGDVELTVQGRAHRLGAGQSLYFDSIFEHKYKARSDALVVIVQQKK